MARNNNREVVPRNFSLFDEFERFFQTALQPMDAIMSNIWQQNPFGQSSVQNQSTNSQFRLKVNIGDFNTEEVQVHVANRQVIVKARHLDSSPNHKNSHFMQTMYSLPASVHENQVQINMRDGQLMIEAPMHQALSSPHPTGYIGNIRN